VALDPPDLTTARLVLVVFGTCALVAAGFVAIVNGEQRLGVLVTAAGLTYLLERLLQEISTSLTFTIGYAITGLWAGLLIHALVTFPTGRIENLAERVAVVAGYLLTSAANLPEWAYLDWHAFFPPGSPDYLLTIHADAELAHDIRRVTDIVTFTWLAASVLLIGHRVLRASPPTRRAFGAVWLTSVAFLGLFITIVGAGLGWLPAREVYGTWLEVAVATVPVVLAATLILARLAQDRLVTLMVDLERRDPAMDLRQALQRALADPSLDIVYWREEPGEWIDGDGAPVTLPNGDAGRAVTPIERGDGHVGALVHDPILLRSPDRMQTATAAAGLALDNERLKADLRARLQDLRASRARIVEAGDRERQRVERNLHDGAQQRLMNVAMVVRLAESRAQAVDADLDGLLGEAADELDGAIRDLRELARGLHPAILTDVGLEGALESLVERSSVPVQLTLDVARPLPDPAQAGAYYVVAEALANVTRHAHANRASVRLTQSGDRLRLEVFDDGRGGATPTAGSGLQGLGDRVDALGGRLEIDSPAGGGTRLVVELPCG